MIIIDKLCYLSKLRYVNPMEKFVFAMLTLVFCIVNPSMAFGLFIIGINSYLTIVKGGISAGRYAKLMLVPLTFLLMSTLAIVVNLSKQPLDAFSFAIGSWYITGSRTGILHALRLAIKALASVSCLYFLSLNTTMTDILGVLRKLHIPPLVVELMLLIYRYIFVLLDVAYYITTSQHARLGYRDFRTSIRSFAALVQALFIRAMQRSRNLYDAMEARCYDGEIRVLEENHPASRKNIALIALYQLALLVFTVWAQVQG